MKHRFKSAFYLMTLLPAFAFAEITRDDLLLPQDTDILLGEMDAPVTIIEYSSMSCPHCASFHMEILPSIKEKYIETGKVRFMNRHFPLNAAALQAAKITLCVEPEQHHTFTNVYYQLQQKWAFTTDYEDNIAQIAKVGGMSEEAIKECFASTEIEEQLLKNRQTGSELLNVDSTPSFFINGIKYEGPHTVADFSDTIDAALKAASVE